MLIRLHFEWGLFQKLNMHLFPVQVHFEQPFPELVELGGLACQRLGDKCPVKQESKEEKLRKQQTPDVLLLWKIIITELFSI